LIAVCWARKKVKIMPFLSINESGGIAAHNDRALRNTSVVTQNTMERAIKVQQAAQELAILADQLQQLVGTFRV
jgi:methyl-accepting chemotaxis protein